MDKSKKSGQKAGVLFAWTVVLCLIVLFVAGTVKLIQVIFS